MDSYLRLQVFLRKLKLSQLPKHDKVTPNQLIKPLDELKMAPADPIPEQKAAAILPKSNSIGSDLAHAVKPRPKRTSLPCGPIIERPEICLPTRDHWKIDPSLIQHKGGCHCGAVRFEVFAPDIITVTECNCSLCHKKQMKHFCVPMMHFKLVKGHDTLKTYSFNSHKAKHSFCSVCGVETFFIPRDNPEGYAVVVHTIDEGSVKKFKTEKLDGKHRKETAPLKTPTRRFSKDATKC